MKYAVIIFIALVAGLFAFAYFMARSDRHARIVYSRFELRRALQDLQETGGLRAHTNSLSIDIPHPFLFTNIVTVDGTNYRCAVAYDDPIIHNAGFLAATTNGVFIFFDKKRGPRLIPSE
jgi:hypothetical protein